MFSADFRRSTILFDLSRGCARLIHLRTEFMEGLARLEELRCAYDGAFERLRTEVRTLKFAERDRNEDLLDHLQQRVKEAELVYRQRRVELAQYILARQGQGLEEVAAV